MVEPRLDLDEPLAQKRLGSGVSPWLVAILLVLIAALLLGYFRPLIPSPVHDPTATPRPVTARGELAADEMSTIEVFHTARNSVVHITTTTLARDRLTRNLFEIPQGAGTGFIWDEQGHVVTNYHVIDKARGARISLFDGTTYPARYVGGVREQDIAVLKIDAPTRDLQPILIGTSSDLQVGQKVFAIGNPFGLDQTLTTGVISGLNRDIPLGSGQSGEMIRGVIQTDAAINPGNSGGPLLDSAGRLIGMNSAIYSPSGAYAGVGFAIQVDEINRIVPQLIRTGRVERVGLGVTIVSDEIVNSLVESGDLPRAGVLIVEVLPGGAAAKAGLRPTRESGEGITWGDLVVAVDEIPVASLKDLNAAFDGKSVGDEITLTIYRDGEPLQVKLTLQAI